MCNNSDIDRNIFELEPKYSWNARVRLACCLTKKNIPKNSDLSDIKGAIDHFEMAKKIINDDFLGDLSILSVLNDMIFSSYAINRGKKKAESFKTKIQLQNEKRKHFLEITKSLIDENISTIQKFIKEYKKMML